MESKRLIALSALAGLAAASMVADAAPFSMASRLQMGPSLNKDVAASGSGSAAGATVAASPAGTPTAAGSGGTPPVGATPANTSAAPASPFAATVPGGTVHPTLPTPPSAQGSQTPAVVVLQPERAPTAMDRAGQMVRSVLRKIDPKAPVVAPGDNVDLARAQKPQNGPSVSTTAPVSIASNEAPAPAAGAGPAPSSTDRPAPISTSMNRQDRKVSADASKETRQLQRGIMNDQKMNVGATQ